MSIELELSEEEAAVVGEALECFITHPTTEQEGAEVAIDLSHHLLALASGHFDDWGETEEEFVQQGSSAREQSKSTLCLVSNDPIDW